MQGATCTIDLNSETGGTEVNQSLPIIDRETSSHFLSLPQLLSLAFCCSQYPHLKVTALTCHRAKSIALILRNNRGLCPWRQTYFSLSKTHVSFSSSCDLLTQHRTCAPVEVDRGGCCTIFSFLLYVTFIWVFSISNDMGSVAHTALQNLSGLTQVRTHLNLQQSQNCKYLI